MVSMELKKSSKCKQNSIVDTFVLVPNKGWVKFHLEQACGCCVMPSKQFVSYITASENKSHFDDMLVMMSSLY